MVMMHRKLLSRLRNSVLEIQISLLPSRLYFDPSDVPMTRNKIGRLRSSVILKSK